jgi:hypothetical protein
LLGPVYDEIFSLPAFQKFSFSYFSWFIVLGFCTVRRSCC